MYLKFLLFNTFIYVLAIDKTETYGPYKVTLNDLVKVQGVKKSDCNSYEAIYDQRTGKLGIDMNVTKNVPVLMSKIIVYIVKQDSKKLLLQYNMKKPCEHFLMGPYFRAFFNTTKTCVIGKGIYSVKVDVLEIIEKFFGVNFFYGEYLIKGYSISTNCDILCMESTVTFVKKL